MVEPFSLSFNNTVLTWLKPKLEMLEGVFKPWPLIVWICFSCFLQWESISSYRAPGYSACVRLVSIHQFNQQPQPTLLQNGYMSIHYFCWIWGTWSRCRQHVKGSGHCWWLLKQIISIKPYLLTSNGERLIVKHILRNSSLWSEVIFKKEVIFNEFDCETSHV